MRDKRNQQAKAQPSNNGRRPLLMPLTVSKHAPPNVTRLCVLMRAAMRHPMRHPTRSPTSHPACFGKRGGSNVAEIQTASSGRLRSKAMSSHAATSCIDQCGLTYAARPTIPAPDPNPLRTNNTQTCCPATQPNAAAGNTEDEVANALATFHVVSASQQVNDIDDTRRTRKLLWG
jgi:hypothetical protein